LLDVLADVIDCAIARMDRSNRSEIPSFIQRRR
jgi:hypothetical protein